MRRRLLPALPLLALAATHVAGQTGSPLTVPERTEYRETSRYADVVGFLDDSSSPISLARGYFAGDLPDLVVYDSTAVDVARAAAETWDGLPDDDFVDAAFREFLTRFGLAFLPEKPSLYRVVPGRVVAY